MSAPRLAEALKVLRAQVDARWPGRHTDSDGWIGDEAHQHRISDHDPDDNGVVTAIDITHDPRSGCDSYALADVLVAARDPRVKYIISNHRICSSEVAPWKWRDYHGINPHDHHVHISVIDVPRLYDDVKPWNLDARPMPPPTLLVVVPPTLREGAEGSAVMDLQRALAAMSIAIRVDGVFGSATRMAVRTFQKSRGLVADGVVGPQTWAALK